MWSRFYLWIVVALSAFAFCGCHDDIDVPVESPADTGQDDNWIGNQTLIRLCEGADKLTDIVEADITLYIQAPDNNIISRTCSHVRNGECSELSLAKGLKEEVYRLLYLECTVTSSDGKTEKTEYGLGCRVKLSSGLSDIVDAYDSDMELFGAGTKESPYVITSYTHLLNLASKVNDKETNSLITDDTWFKQYVPIDLSYASFKCDNSYGWMPIGNSTEPFRGRYVGKEIAGMWIKRPNSCALGLFGCIDNAVIQNVKITGATIEGNYAVGTVVGAVVTRGDSRDCSAVDSCEMSNCTVTGSPGSFSIGGIVGAVDVLARANIYGCKTSEGSVTSAYNAGGIVGGCGIYSRVSISNCENNISVTSQYAGAGGIIATGDTLDITACNNSGAVTGGTSWTAGDTQNSGRGTGGIAGGCGMSTIVSCVNTGTVGGKEGTGGILGSTRIAGGEDEANIYNSVVLRYCGNEGDVSGTQCVGGICGEAQFGGYTLYNTGKISGDSYIAGIVGYTTSTVLNNMVNSGGISGTGYVSGITGKTDMGTFAMCHNYGEISGSSNVAGVCGLGSNNTLIHYCGNFGAVKGNSPVGGIVAEIGDPREWTGMNIAECVVGAVDIVLGVISPSFTILVEVTGLLHGLHIAFEVVEMGVIAVDWCLLGVGIYELCEEHEVHEIEAEIETNAENIRQQIIAEINTIRGSVSPGVSGDFSASIMKDNYNSNVQSQNDYIAMSEENSMQFQDSINYLRQERSEAIEEKMKTKELVHTVISGVAVTVSTVASICAVAVSAGTAAPFIVAASAGAIVGGANAVVKASTDYSENSVIIWQCVNSGAITGTDAEKTGGIGGIIHDMSIVRDCINTADGGCGGSIAGTIKNNAEAYRNLSISGNWDDMFVSSLTAKIGDDNYQYSSTGSDGTKYVGLTAAEIADPSSYSGWDFSSKWVIPSGSNCYPIPNVSDVRKN